MSMLRNKKILLFAPVFFGYENEISKKLTEYANQVYLYDERPSNSFIVKSLIRFFPRILSEYIRKYFSKIIDRHKTIVFDYILFFKGETVSRNLIISLRSAFPQSKILLYLIDSLNNYPHIEKCLNLFDKVLSFDLNDTLNIKRIEFRSLFYLTDYKQVMPADTSIIKYDILFIGTVHSDRWHFLKMVQAQAKAKGLKVHYYLYFQSRLIFLFRKLTCKNFWSFPIKYAKFAPLSKNEVISLFKNSSAIIDIQHPNQSGLTMRTLEVFGAKRKLITTNSQIVNYDFYNPSNIMVVDRKNPSINIEFIKSKYNTPDVSVFEKYSIDSWLNDVFPQS